MATVNVEVWFCPGSRTTASGRIAFHVPCGLLTKLKTNCVRALPVLVMPMG